VGNNLILYNNFMAIRKIPLTDGEYYHIYNRGNSKQKIFLDKEDYFHFVKLLFICNSVKKFKFRDNIVDIKIDAFDFERKEALVSIGAWVLMPNHFHLYITTSHQSDWWESLNLNNKNRISEFMRKLLTAYTLYFNKKYKRTGSLFEGKFKSVLVEDDNQAKYHFSYIHLNPIKLIQKNWKENGIINIDESLSFLNKYKMSSYLDHKGSIRSENKILNLIDFPKYFSTLKNFDEEIIEWLQYKN
jgi:putative transposase